MGRRNTLISYQNLNFNNYGTWVSAALKSRCLHRPWTLREGQTCLVRETFVYTHMTALHTNVLHTNTTGMQHNQAYQSCCVCTHAFTPGLVRACDFDGFRRFLAVTSRGRMRRLRSNGQTYEFSEVERRPPAQHRDTKFVRECLQAGRQLRMNLLGHKHAPLIAKWPGFDWWRVNVPELMHDSKIFTEMLLRILVGKGSDGMYKYWTAQMDTEHRVQSEARRVFKSIWIRSSGPNAPLPWFV